jgi:hypothetical protein
LPGLPTIDNPVLPTFFIVGLVFGVLAAAAAYVISYNEYRQRMLRLDQNPRRMAVRMAVVTFVVFFGGSILLAFVLRPGS